VVDRHSEIHCRGRHCLRDGIVRKQCESLIDWEEAVRVPFPFEPAGGFPDYSTQRTPKAQRNYCSIQGGSKQYIIEHVTIKKARTGWPHVEISSVLGLASEEMHFAEGISHRSKRHIHLNAVRTIDVPRSQSVLRMIGKS
jgi:hypothetical protein